MSPHLKLAIGAATIVGATIYLAYLGASTSWQYYVLVDECARSPAELVGQRIRVSGRVATGSLSIRSDRGEAVFDLQGQVERIRAVCAGPLPDNLTEDIEVVVEGRLTSAGQIEGDRVLTKCASKYQASGASAANSAPKGA